MKNKIRQKYKFRHAVDTLNMGKYIDFILLRLALFVLIFICMLSLSKKLIESLLLSVIVFAAISIMLELIRHLKKKKFPYQKYVRYFAIEGNESVKESLKLLFDKEKILEESADTLLINKNGQRILYMISFRFSSCSVEDFAKCYRSAKKKQAQKAILVGRETQRSTLTVLSEFSLPVSFLSGKDLYKILEKQQKLPLLPQKEKPKHKKLKNLYDIVFSENHAKHFLTTGVILAVFCIFTPLKTYYIITSCIAFFMGLLCLLLPHKKSDACDAIEGETTENDKQDN